MYAHKISRLVFEIVLSMVIEFNFNALIFFPSTIIRSVSLAKAPNLTRTFNLIGSADVQSVKNQVRPVGNLCQSRNIYGSNFVSVCSRPVEA